MFTHFSKDQTGKNIIQVKPETEFEKQVLEKFGSGGEWVKYPDEDVTMVIYEQR